MKWQDYFHAKQSTPHRLAQHSPYTHPVKKAGWSIGESINKFHTFRRMSDTLAKILSG